MLHDAWRFAKCVRTIGSGAVDGGLGQGQSAEVEKRARSLRSG